VFYKTQKTEVTLYKTKKEQKMTAKIITVANRKGGCSKTTTVKALGEILSSEHNKRVLLVDLDPQGNLTDWTQASTTDKNTSYELLVGKANVTDDVIQHTDMYDIVPADEVLSQAESELMSKAGHEFALKSALEPVADNYDYIIIDTPPTLGVLSIVAFVASNSGVVIVTDSGMSATKGMNKLIDSLNAIRKFYNPQCIPLGVLLTCYNDHFCNDKKIAAVTAGLLDAYNIPFFDARIRTSVKIKESTTYALPILEVAKNSAPLRDYEQFTLELLASLESSKVA
jgi:chromosome partitioning protein